MPFMRGDSEALEEVLSEVNPADLPPGFDAQNVSEDFVYEAAETKFTPAKLAEPDRIVLDALRAMGATQFRVRYDGGDDEGFAHPEYLAFGANQRPAEDVAAELAKSPVVERVRKAAGQQRYNPYEETSDDLVARYALDSLAHKLASKLLGDSYGTGEYQLYGAFTADLVSGEIVDDPTAPQPEGM
ncbi:MAG: hypothetical protein JWP03_2467 [Phycisphaerales bacterium]|nr:hypothetical protein [Phycisphaerales bacterium]